MELRRNPQRLCKPECIPHPLRTTKIQVPNATLQRAPSAGKDETARKRRRLSIDSRIDSNFKNRQVKPLALQTSDDRPFPFFELPLEIRHMVYSHLVVKRSLPHESVLEAIPILKKRKKRTTAEVARHRLNQRRMAGGKRPITARKTGSEPEVDLSLLQVSQRVHDETTDHLYSNNWFAITLSKLPTLSIETPYGWNLQRVKKLQLELQLKDAPRMNSYIDWSTFFSTFSSLRFLRVVFTFHPRYIDWASPELSDWATTNYVYKAFFRELLVAVPSHAELKLGPPLTKMKDLKAQSRTAVSQKLLLDMYTELGTVENAVVNRRTAMRVVEWKEEDHCEP
ncbi:hypothetical protein IQ07DRAFT_511551 [Pyrenochaeta sp. DS3sAY3a]|nr:hypothetical protein IQ07DRAFT_511551 [Pyrenochaeta sp. DS3sAY3a]